MCKHILMATDGSELAQKASDHGLTLAKALNAKATALSVTEPWDVVVMPEAPIIFPPTDYEAGVAESAGKILAGTKVMADKMGVLLDEMSRDEPQYRRIEQGREWSYRFNRRWMATSSEGQWNVP